MIENPVSWLILLDHILKTKKILRCNMCKSSMNSFISIGQAPYFLYSSFDTQPGHLNNSYINSRAILSPFIYLCFPLPLSFFLSFCIDITIMYLSQLLIIFLLIQCSFLIVNTFYLNMIKYHENNRLFYCLLVGKYQKSYEKVNLFKTVYPTQ